MKGAVGLLVLVIILALAIIELRDDLNAVTNRVSRLERRE